MRRVGTSEVKNRLSALLEQVERGAEFVITKRGKPVARRGPVGHGYDKAAARRAVRAMRDLAKEMKLGNFDWNEWKDCRDLGRP